MKTIDLTDDGSDNHLFIPICNIDYVISAGDDFAQVFLKSGVKLDVH